MTPTLSLRLSGFWLLTRNALEQVGRAEVKLFLVFLGTVLVSILTASSLVGVQGTVKIDMEFFDCGPELAGDLKTWIDQQPLQRNVRVTPDPWMGDVTSAKQFHIEYESRNFLELGAPPLPPPFSNNCHVHSYGPTTERSGVDFAIFTLGGQLAMDAVIAVLVFIALGKKRQQLVPGSTLLAGIRTAPLWPMAFALCTATIAFVISYVAQHFGFDLGTVRSNAVLTDQLARYPVAVGLFSIAISPFFEELLFRRWLLHGFMDGGFPKLGSIATSVNFALIHFGRAEISSTAAIYFVLIFSISLALCWVYIRTRNIWASTAMHATHNAVSLCLVLLFDPTGN